LSIVMRSDMDSFSGELFDLFRGMLDGENGLEVSQTMRKGINGFKRNKVEFRRDPNYVEAYRTVVSLIITNSWWRTGFLNTKRFDERFKDLLASHPDFHVPEYRDALIDLCKDVTPLEKTIPKVSVFLNQLEGGSLLEWSEGLNESLDTSVLGPKGRDNFLRDFGWWGRVPMDRHEMRFIIRSGIFHEYGSRDGYDPLEKEDLQKALARFCGEELAGRKIEGIDLGRAPGIVDYFIWMFCASKTNIYRNMGVCGKTPKCGLCPLTHCSFNPR